MKLKKYRRKRDFSKTPEPIGEVKASSRSRKPRGLYVIQKHQASTLHYDFRLEANGVLKSWAIPRGPSLDPRQKRLAVEVEDHPINYAQFEGIIPSGEYGAGKVIVWDNGYYEPLSPDDDLASLMTQEVIKIIIHGQKLHGGFVLVKTRWSGKKNNWLLIKEQDDYVRLSYDIGVEEPLSVISGKEVSEID